MLAGGLHRPAARQGETRLVPVYGGSLRPCCDMRVKVSSATRGSQGAAGRACDTPVQACSVLRWLWANMAVPLDLRPHPELNAIEVGVPDCR